MDFKTKVQTSPTITKAVTFALVDAEGLGTPLDTELSYNPADPYAVSAVFHTIAGPVAWTFGRDLLIGGLYEPTGDGDVHVWPCSDNDGRAVVMIELCSPDGEALVQADTAALSSFVEAVTVAVAPGHEATMLDMDSTIAAIFAAEAA